MSKPWGGIGAWAAEAERAEAEEQEAAAAAASESQSFPSLKDAVSAKPKKKKMSLFEFNSGPVGFGHSSTAATEYKGLTPDEMSRLPTGPKERSAEEMQHGRGFSSYGRSGLSSGRMRDRDDRDGPWGGGRRSYGGFDDERGSPPSRVSEFDQTSRADEVDNWAMGKKSLPSVDSGRQSRYGSLGGGAGDVGMGVGSRADEIDNWASTKKPLPPARSSTFGYGFRNTGREHDRWTTGAPLPESDRERPKLVLDPPKGDAGANERTKSDKPSPFGAARPREDVLAEKGLDWKKLDSEMEAKKTSRPTSSHSSRPSSAQSSRSEDPGLQGIENAIKPRPKANPFGDAKPREVLLQERGVDWRKIDLELDRRRVDRSETEEEKFLKEEIDQLKKEIERESETDANNEAPVETGRNRTTIIEVLNQKERELESLIRDLDDKVRLGPKVERPGSGTGRPVSNHDRPSSRSGSVEDSRSVDFTDRPRSRGTSDVWTRPVDDDRRGGFRSGRDRGFMSSKNLDRSGSGSRSRERW